jgi:hypothetical protein
MEISIPRSERGTWLSVAAALFALLGVTNLLKPLELNSEQGFVLFGQRLSGTPNLVAGPLFGLFLLAFAWAIWTMRSAALPMARLYASYVLVNLILFSIRMPPPANAGMGWRIFTLVYAVVAIGVSAGTARVLSTRRNDLV